MEAGSLALPVQTFPEIRCLRRSAATARLARVPLEGPRRRVAILGTREIYLYTTYSCDLTHIWEWDPFVGLYVYLWTTGGCTFREYYWDPSVGGPTPTLPTPPDSVIAGNLEPLRPDEVAPDWWNALNKDEKWRCIANVQRCVLVGAYRNYAREWADSLAAANNTTQTWDNIYDARRHALWSALMAQEFGQEEAHWWGDTHEKYRPADEAPSVCMDLHNNSVGRSIAAGFNGVYHNLIQVKAAVLDAQGLEPEARCP